MGLLKLIRKVAKRISNEDSRIFRYPPFSLYYRINELSLKADLIRSNLKIDGRHARISSDMGEFWINIKDFDFARDLWNGVYEKKTTSLVKEKINKGDVVVDVGAHIGYYTTLFSKLVGDEGTVFAFEPEPNNFNLLKRNTKHSNVVRERKIVSDKNGNAELNLRRDKPSHHSIIFSESNDSVDVKTVKLDSYFSDFDNGVDLVKIDVEGAEPLVLKGMKSLLEKEKPQLVLEIDHFFKTDFDPEESLSKLKGLDYSFYLIKEDANLVQTEIDNLISQECSQRNIFCTPSPTISN